MFAGYLDAALDARRVRRRRLVPHRRPRGVRRRVPHDRRPAEGHHHPRRREHLGAGGRVAARHASRRRRGRVRRGARSGDGREGVRVRDPARRAPRSTLEELRAHLVDGRPGAVQAAGTARGAHRRSPAPRAARCRRRRCASSWRPPTRSRTDPARPPAVCRPAGGVHNEDVAKRPPDDDDALEVIDLFSRRTDHARTARGRHLGSPDRTIPTDDRARRRTLVRTRRS